jgi:hypothetical protein
MFNRIKNALYQKLSFKKGISRRGECFIVKRKNDDENIWNILTGLALGFSGFLLLSYLKKPECPNCKTKIEKGVSLCDKCGIKLEWK